MFWKKPLLLLGLLAAAANAAPSSLAKRLDIEDQDETHTFFRADARGPEAVKAAGGFASRAKSNKCKEKDINFSMWDHCKPATAGFANKMNDCYVSVSELFFVTVGWLEEKVPNGIESGTIYKIASSPIFISCSDTLGAHNPIPDEVEFVAIDEIPWGSVIGWYDTFTTRPTQKNKIADAVYHANPDYDPAKYPKSADGGARPRLAGFPKNHKAWKESPWKDFKDEVCDRSGAAAKRALENRSDEDMSPANEETHLIARKSRSRKSRTKKTKTTPKKTTPKKTPKKTKPKKTTPKEPKCTAKMAKAGKCCTKKMKKQGKCPAQQCAYDPKRQNKKQYLLQYRKIAKTGKVPPKDKPTSSGSKTSKGTKAKGTQ
ncbi:hypothetical protein N0V90_012593 [Kalmusia sp. IMI 367209]|nr:hypothetical protein N0V90_012593 [Kalmusia sp. IMI 367209]